MADLYVHCGCVFFQVSDHFWNLSGSSCDFHDCVQGAVNASDMHRCVHTSHSCQCPCTPMSRVYDQMHALLDSKQFIEGIGAAPCLVDDLWDATELRFLCHRTPVGMAHEPAALIRCDNPR